MENQAWKFSIVVVGALTIGAAVGDIVRASAQSGTTPPANSQQITVEVYKDPSCGCCSKWVEHLRKQGFTVRVTETHNIEAFKANHHVPGQLWSCHTALVQGYVLEGHVPAADVQRLLKERPAIAGLAVPGMPIGSPGMEMPGSKAQAYDVVSFDKDRKSRVFASHGR